MKLPMRKRQDGATDMTPMVDVTFLLLIFFMVTAAFSLRRAIEIPSPRDDRPSEVAVDREDPPTILRLVVDRDGGFYLLTPSTQYELVGKQNLIEHLAAEFDKLGDSDSLRIEVDSDARLQRLVDAMDAATIAGFDQLVVTELTAEFS